MSRVDISLKELLSLPEEEKERPYRLVHKFSDEDQKGVLINGFKNLSVKFYGRILGSIEFTGTDIESLEIGSIIVEGDLIVDSFSSIRSKLFISQSIIHGNVEIPSCKVESQGCEYVFDRLEINGNVIIHSGIITGGVKLSKCKISGRTNLVSLKIEKNLTLHDCHFKNTVLIYSSEINGKLRISSCTFHQNTKLTNNIFNDRATIIDVNFMKGFDIFTSTFTHSFFFHSNRLGFYDCAHFNEVKLPSIGDVVSFHITENQREGTFRLLKKLSMENGDSYEAGLYGYLEAMAKRKKLWKSLKGGKLDGASTKSQILQDYLILLLNQWSNRHKTSWVQAVVFTLTVVVIFFGLILISGRFEGQWLTTEEYSMLFFGLLNPLHRLDLYEGLPLGKFELNEWVHALDYLARVFVGYGYYQFVQAFRRFK